MSKGTVVGYKNMDAKGKVTGFSKTTCYDTATDSAGAIIYNVKTEISDANNAFMSS